MRFYGQQHKFYCSIDLHARKMYVCIIDSKGKIKVHQNMKTGPRALFDINFPLLEDVVIEQGIRQQLNINLSTQMPILNLSDYTSGIDIPGTNHFEPNWTGLPHG